MYYDQEIVGGLRDPGVTATNILIVQERITERRLKTDLSQHQK